MVPWILAWPPSLLSACGWLKGMVGRAVTSSSTPSPSLCDLGLSLAWQGLLGIVDSILLPY